MLLVAPIFALLAGVIGRNLPPVRERDDVILRFIQIEPSYNLKWFGSLIFGPELIPEVAVLETCTKEDIQRIQAAIPEANVWIVPLHHGAPFRKLPRRINPAGIDAKDVDW